MKVGIIGMEGELKGRGYREIGRHGTEMKAIGAMLTTTNVGELLEQGIRNDTGTRGSGQSTKMNTDDTVLEAILWTRRS